MNTNFVLTCAIVKDFPNYMIYSDGTCKNIKTGRILKPSIKKSNNGKDIRYCYRLYNKFGVKAILRYRLVGLNLIPNPNNLPELDHIDGDSTNDIISNLRWVSSLDNKKNRNETDSTGVYFNKRAQKWYAHIKLNYKDMHLGSFNTKIEAQAARKIAKEKYHKIL